MGVILYNGSEGGFVVRRSHSDSLGEGPVGLQEVEGGKGEHLRMEERS